MDTGASKNYIKPLPEFKNVIPASTPFLVKSLHGNSHVNKKYRIKLFGVWADFFILPNMATFDGIIGLDLLKRVNTQIDLSSGVIRHDFGNEKLLFHECVNVNFIDMRSEEIPSGVRNDFLKMMESRKRAFADQNESLQFNTNIVATIKTKNEEPIYSRLYPYPMSVAEFVNGEVAHLLANGHSPFQIHWVVDKKRIDDAGNKKKRLVIDFRKLNEVTVEDKYPMPNPMVILSNLKGAQYFTTLDLKPGFHQIELIEKKLPSL